MTCRRAIKQDYAKPVRRNSKPMATMKLVKNVEVRDMDYRDHELFGDTKEEIHPYIIKR